jgi:hypothetical protein
MTTAREAREYWERSRPNPLLGGLAPHPQRLAPGLIMLISGPPALSRKIVTRCGRGRRSAHGRLGWRRVQAGGRLVEEQHLRVAGQQPPAKAIRWRGLWKALHASPARLTARRAWSMRSFKSAVLVEAGETFEFSATLKRRYRTGDSGMIEIRQRISTPFSGVSGIPATVAEPKVGATEQAERPHRRGLPGAVRPQEIEHLPVADLKGNVSEGDPVTEALAQIVDAERARELQHGRYGSACARFDDRSGISGSLVDRGARSTCYVSHQGKEPTATKPPRTADTCAPCADQRKLLSVT